MQENYRIHDDVYNLDVDSPEWEQLELNFSQYQKIGHTTAQYPNKQIMDPLLYTVLGITGESGEIAEKIKKIWRNKVWPLVEVDGEVQYEAIFTEEWRHDLAKEIGDVLWYLQELAGNIGYTLNDCAKINLKKLLDRKKRDVIRSEGDNR